MEPIGHHPEHAPLALVPAALLTLLIFLLPGCAAFAVVRARGVIKAFFIGAVPIIWMSLDPDLTLVRRVAMVASGREEMDGISWGLWFQELPALIALCLGAFAGLVAGAAHSMWRALHKLSVCTRLGTVLRDALIGACPICCVVGAYLACRYLLPASVTFKRYNQHHGDLVPAPCALLLWLLAFALPGCLALGAYRATGRLRLFYLASALPILAAMRQCAVFATDMTRHAFASVASLWIVGLFSGVAAVALDSAVTCSRANRVLVSCSAASGRATFSLSAMLTTVGILCVLSAALFAPLNRVTGVLLYLLLVFLPASLLVGVLRAHGPLYAFSIGAMFAAAACLLELSPRPLSGGLSVFHKLRRSELVEDRRIAREYWKFALLEGSMAAGAQSALRLGRRAEKFAKCNRRIYYLAPTVALCTAGVAVMVLAVIRLPIQIVLPAVAFAVPGCLGAAIAYARGPLRGFCIGAVCIVTQGTLVLIKPGSTIGTLDFAFYEGLLAIAGICGCVIAASDWATRRKVTV